MTGPLGGVVPPDTPRARWRFPVALFFLIALLVLCGRGVGPLPPLGALLDPAYGVWSMPARADLAASADAQIPGLGTAVTVLYDDRAVPHIFAASEPDAYRALGFVVARDRLFQLELQTLAASGRLTEVAGARALDTDRQMRNLGLPRAARHAYAALDSASEVRAALDAFAAGVNAYIERMPPGALPIEYRLLGRRPERWEPVNSMHLLGRMGWVLAFEDDLVRARARALVGAAATDAIFPARSPIQEPIQPNGRRGPRYDFEPIPPPGPPDTMSAALVVALERFHADRPPDALGSNNWAVGPARSASGFAILAGDPHLELTLPSIWYETHLSVPGRLDVYGVTIPGAPGIVIGFNRDIAWSFTNTQADVLDYYLETVDDTASPTRYRVDGEWRSIEMQVERYAGRRGEIVATDTIRYSHRGPMTRVGARWLSLRWTVLEAGAEAAVLGEMARARGVDDYRRITERWAAPAQNMIVADRAGHIAIRTTGRFPVRPGSGRGDAVRDGSLGANDWQSDWPVARYPGAVDPAQGFVASANQQPVDPNVDPSYLGADWYSPWRAIRINTLLRAAGPMTPDLMTRMQTDPGSARADFFVPVLLAASRARPRDARCATSARLLAEWTRTYTRDDRRAVLFEAVMTALRSRLWDELRSEGRRAPTPQDQVTASLTADSASLWWDERATPAVERRDDVLCAALDAGHATVVKDRGQPDDERWRWDAVNRATIPHLLRLPALGERGIAVQGGPSTLNPIAPGSGYGPSWRMVVELGPEIRAWGTYPGGQSGNPLSVRYRDRIDRWSTGQLDTLRFPRRPQDIPGTRVSATLTLAPR